MVEYSFFCLQQVFCEGRSLGVIIHVKFAETDLAHTCVGHVEITAFHDIVYHAFGERLPAFVMVGKNKEMKKLYKYLTTRKENQLKKKQAIVAIIGKILHILYAVVTKNEKYKATRVFTQERIEQLKVA